MSTDFAGPIVRAVMEVTDFGALSRKRMASSTAGCISMGSLYRWIEHTDLIEGILHCQLDPLVM